MLARMGDADRHRYIAIVGAGPAGFFAAEALLHEPDVCVHLFERLAAPYGLVRYGVAPDHQKIKSVAAGFERTGKNERLRYFGNVTVGRDISVTELSALYAAVVFATGCEQSRKLGVPGEQLTGVHSALEIVSWYNGHPDYAARNFDLRVRSAVVVGAGDVSIDVARLLTSDQAALAKTDMPDHVLEGFAERQIEEVHFLVRRGPEHAGFALKELRGLLDRPSIGVHCDPLVLDQAMTAPDLPKPQRAKLEYIRARASESPNGDAMVHFRFLRSPKAFIGSNGKLEAVELGVNAVHTRAIATGAVDSGHTERLSAELAILAVGYRSQPIPGLPIVPDSGIAANTEGQILRDDGELDPSTYAVGWLKRGPQGVIGTNKGDAKATVDRLLRNLGQSTKPAPMTQQLLDARGVRHLSFEQWLQLDELERARGAELGKPRQKLINLEQILTALGAA
jgi:ferredoxin--NADP+ reductase